jgi:YesN/AraC family two-component response regulator
MIAITSCQNIESLYSCLSEIINYYLELYKKCYSSFSKEFFNEVTSFIDENYAKPLTREEMARKFHYHPVYFGRIFKRIMGMPYQDYLRKVRIEKAKELMKKTSLTISEIAFEVGYQNFNVFWEAFKSREGISPREWRRKL